MAKALGLIETLGLVPAIEAIDVCLKTANVELIDYELVRGAIVTIKISGDVAAVKASVNSGAAAAERVGTLLSQHVIPRPAEDTDTMTHHPEWTDNMLPAPHNKK